MNEIKKIMRRLRRRGFDYIKIEQLGDGTYSLECEKLDCGNTQFTLDSQKSMLFGLRNLEKFTKE